MAAIETGHCGHVDKGVAREGNSIDADHRSDSEYVFRRIERLALAREQASVALRRRLLREGYNDDVIEQALARALSCGLVDDTRYAEVLVRSRLSQGRGRKGIAAELADLDITPTVVSELLGIEDDDAEEVERALAVLERKPPSVKNRREGAYRRLMQKGYGTSVATTVARRWSESHTS